MNGSYFKNPNFPEVQNTNPGLHPGYELNTLNLNVGKKIKAFASFPNVSEKHRQEFSGIIEAVTHEYLIISDPTSGNWYLLPIKYLDYIEFEEKIIY